MTKLEQLFDKAEKLLAARGDEDYLGDAVHEAKCAEASDINDQGFRAQLEYLAGDDEYEFLETLIEELEAVSP